MNSQLRQKGNTSEMMFNINEQIAYMSHFFVLNPGDLLLTGNLIFFLELKKKFKTLKEHLTKLIALKVGMFCMQE